MKRVQACITWLLMAFWPAALLHCDLEAAGIDWPLLVHDDHDDANSHGHGDESSSAAHPSHDIGIQGAGSGIKVRCPELWLVAEQSPLMLCLCERQSTSPPPRTDEPVSWIKTWRFDQRAALPARAPDFRA